MYTDSANCIFWSTVSCVTTKFNRLTTRHIIGIGKSVKFLNGEDFLTSQGIVLLTEHSRYEIDESRHQASEK